MDDAAQAGTQQGGFALMVEWLRTKDKQKNEAAVSILCRAGEPVVEFLALEAIKPGRRPDQLWKITSSKRQNLCHRQVVLRGVNG